MEMTHKLPFFCTMTFLSEQHFAKDEVGTELTAGLV